MPPISEDIIFVVAVKEWYWDLLVTYGVRVETIPLEKACLVHISNLIMQDLRIAGISYHKVDQPDQYVCGYQVFPAPELRYGIRLFDSTLDMLALIIFKDRLR